MHRRHEGRDRGLKQLPERSLIKGQRSGCLFSLIVMEAGRGHRAAPEDVGEDGGAGDVLDDERDEFGELVLAEAVSESGRPMDIVDGRMRVLIEGKLDGLHGQQGQPVCAGGVPPMLHVPGHREQLRRRHDVCGRVRHDLVRRLEGQRLVFAERQCIQCTVGWVLKLCCTRGTS